MDLLGRGGESSLYVCSDTPVGEFQVRLFLLDGRGGRVDLPLTVEVLEGRIFEGSVRWFESSEEAASSPDTDQDGFEDNVDAFPEDPAASVDEDQDGRPEAWNRGFGEENSTSGLQLDESPGGQPGSGGLPPGVFDSSNWDEATPRRKLTLMVTESLCIRRSLRTRQRRSTRTKMASQTVGMMERRTGFDPGLTLMKVLVVIPLVNLMRRDGGGALWLGAKEQRL